MRERFILWFRHRCPPNFLPVWSWYGFHHNLRTRELQQNKNLCNKFKLISSSDHFKPSLSRHTRARYNHRHLNTFSHQNTFLKHMRGGNQKRRSRGKWVHMIKSDITESSVHKQHRKAQIFNRLVFSPKNILESLCLLQVFLWSSEIFQKFIWINFSVGFGFKFICEICSRY